MKRIAKKKNMLNGKVFLNIAYKISFFLPLFRFYLLVATVFSFYDNLFVKQLAECILHCEVVCEITQKNIKFLTERSFAALKKCAFRLQPRRFEKVVVVAQKIVLV